MELLNSVFNNLKYIINSLVIKYDKKAKLYETLEIKREADKYISALLKQDTFNSYVKFDLDVIINSGVSDTELAELYSKNKNNIPIEKRDEIINLQRQKIINNYVEKNNYYRMLNGKPDIEDINFIYLDNDIYDEYGIPYIPIHLLDNSYISLLDSKGIINDLINKYPDKKYLNYLGDKKIDILVARNSKNFSILRITNNIPDTLFKDFNNIYEQCREYFMSVIYIKEMGYNYNLYDNFIAMMILVMTIQRIITNTFKNGIERDFYDLETIKILFESYNVPFLENLPIDYQRSIMWNLNKLLTFKSTDKVLYDLCSILGFERMKLLKYYLIKEHKMDSNENPVFFFKEIDDGNGGTMLVEDKEKMYDFYFQTVDLNEKNISLALQNNITKEDYDEVIIDDPYWVDDDELKQTLYESEFNYIETKYLHMNVMYKMTEMLFEVVYAFRMIIDKKNEISNFTLLLPKLFNLKQIKLFDVIVFLFALLSKKNNMAGNILIEPSKILSVMGFDFDNDFELIKNDILNSKYIDNNILEYFENMNIVTPDHINDLYKNIKNLEEFLTEKMSTSSSIKEYEAYKKLYNTLLITNETTFVFNKSNNEIATTFLDYLQDSDIDLYDFVVNAEQNDIPLYLEHVLFKINEFIPNLQYLYIINGSNNILLEALIKLIKFFKSYTTDLRDMNILYLMDSRYYNMNKLIDDIHFIYKVMEINDTFNMDFSDNIDTMNSIMTNKEKIKIIDEYKMNAILYLYSLGISLNKINLIDFINFIESRCMNKDIIIQTNKINSIYKKTLQKDKTYISDNFIIQSIIELFVKDNSIKLEDKIKSIDVLINQHDNINTNFSDIIKNIDINLLHKDNMFFHDTFKIIHEE